MFFFSNYNGPFTKGLYFVIFIVFFGASILLSGFFQAPRLFENHYVFVFDKKKSIDNFIDILEKKEISYLSGSNSLVLWNSIPDIVNLNPEGIISVYGIDDPRVDDYIKQHRNFFNDDNNQYIYILKENGFWKIFLTLFNRENRLFLLNWADFPFGVNALNLCSILLFQLLTLFVSRKRKNLLIHSIKSFISGLVFFWGAIPWILVLILELFVPEKKQKKNSGRSEKYNQKYEHNLFCPVPIVGTIEYIEKKNEPSDKMRFILKTASLVFLFLFPILGDQLSDFSRRIPVSDSSLFPVSAKSLYNHFEEEKGALYPGADDYLAHIIFQRFFMYKQKYGLPQPDEFVSLNRYFEKDGYMENSPELLYVFDDSFVTEIFSQIDQHDAISLISGEDGFHRIIKRSYRFSWYRPFSVKYNYLTFGFIFLLLIRVVLYLFENKYFKNPATSKALRRRKKAA